jgi:non-homologous end joining protein Ku
MLDFILNRLDLAIYAIVLIGIYTFLIFLWKKICSLETSVYRLDKIITAICMKQSKEDFVNDSNEMNDVFNKEEKEEYTPKIVIDVVDEALNNIIETKSDTSSSTLNKSKLSKMNVEALKELANKLEISVQGTKPDIINSILESQ